MITPRQYHKYYMPSTADLPKDQQKWVIYDNSPVRPMDSFEVTDYDNPSVRLCKILLSRIQDWNYTDENGEKSPLTWQKVGEIPQEDYKYISEIVLVKIDTGLSTGEKKSSSSTGTPSPSEQPA